MSGELTQVRGAWEELGTADPYWAVLTQDEFRGGKAREDFLEHGRRDARHIVDVLARHGRSPGELAVDFGCGVGRLSYALAEFVPRVVGVDIAESMLVEANACNPYPQRLSFVHNDATTLPFADDSVDLVASVITLQHMPPALSLRYLLEMARVARPGGSLVFQLPSHAPRPEAIPPSLSVATLTVPRAPIHLPPGDRGYLPVSVRNEGDGTWPAERLLNVGNHWYRDGDLLRWDDGRSAVACPLAPGESTEVLLRFRVPDEPGRYELEIDLVQEFVAWWSQRGCTPVRVPVEVTEPSSPTPPEAATSGITGATGVTAADKAAAGMEMHGVAKDVVCGLLAAIGCTVLDVSDDGRAGGNWVSYLYTVAVGG